MAAILISSGVEGTGVISSRSALPLASAIAAVGVGVGVIEVIVHGVDVAVKVGGYCVVIHGIIVHSVVDWIVLVDWDVGDVVFLSPVPRIEAHSAPIGGPSPSACLHRRSLIGEVVSPVETPVVVVVVVGVIVASKQLEARHGFKRLDGLHRMLPRVLLLHGRVWRGARVFIGAGLRRHRRLRMRERSGRKRKGLEGHLLRLVLLHWEIRMVLLRQVVLLMW